MGTDSIRHGELLRMRWNSLLYVLKFSLPENKSKCHAEEDGELFILLNVYLTPDTG